MKTKIAMLLAVASALGINAQPVALVKEPAKVATFKASLTPAQGAAALTAVASSIQMPATLAATNIQTIVVIVAPDGSSTVTVRTRAVTTH